MRTQGHRGLSAPQQVEDIIAQNVELMVREAFVRAAMQNQEYAERGEMMIAAGVSSAVRSSWPRDNKWLTGGPNPHFVMIYTECCPKLGAYVVRDPFRDHHDHELWGHAIERLRQSPWIEDAGWDSINPAVHYVWVRPRLIA
jgi:hypothetical protein